MNAEAIESMVRDVLSKMNSLQGASSVISAPSASKQAATVADYPLANKHPDWVKTATNKTLDDITLESVLSGKITAQDMRITPEILRIQADIARSAGRDRLAMNFERAAELTAVPDATGARNDTTPCAPIVPRKRRADSEADELEQKYQAKICAAFVRQAAGLYQTRKKLKGDD